MGSKPLVFVDGEEGTTGLQILDRLHARPDVEMLHIDPAQRKDPEARRALLNEAAVAILCLPDQAAREAVSLVSNPRTKLIDASTAHRTAPDWAYGIPELGYGTREAIRAASRVCVPGCHATGFVMSVYPLVKLGILPADCPLTCHSITGYSGGGKKLIFQYEDPSVDRNKLNSPRPYALNLKHKHLPEMQVRSGLAFSPIFTPIVDDFYKGMVVSVPLFPRLLARRATAMDIWAALSMHYESEPFVRIMPYEAEPVLDGGFLDVQTCNDTNRVDMFVFGNAERVVVSARLDNLGKGSSGAAVQILNLLLGVEETRGL